MPGTEKMTCTLKSPNQPFSPQTSSSARPTTMGETANGRSSSASKMRLPGKRPRTSAIAANTPKIALSGTAMSVTWIVSQNAEIAAGVVIESMTGWMPCSKVR